MGFLKRLFGKRYIPPVGDGSPHGCWKRGDLAVCIGGRRWRVYETGEPSAFHPQAGDVWRVTGTTFICGIHALSFAESDGCSFSASGFRKALLDKDEACEEEFVTLLNRTKRKISA